MKVYGDFPDVKPGTMITINVKVDPDKKVIATSYHIHKWRSAKHVLSLIALVPVGFIWFRTFRFDKDRREFVYRSGG